MDKIQYLRKKHSKKKGWHGKKKGVLVATPQDDRLAIGFSMCHPTDKFDYIKDRKECGFGLKLAKRRALKMIDSSEYIVQNSYTKDNAKELLDEDEDETRLYFESDTKSVVIVPPTVMRELKDFIHRCRLYYKDKIFPRWVEAVENETPTIRYIPLVPRKG